MGDFGERAIMWAIYPRSPSARCSSLSNCSLTPKERRIPTYIDNICPHNPPMEPTPRVHTLVLEALTWTPHLETAGEIALTATAAGHRAAFCFLTAENPDDFGWGTRAAVPGVRDRFIKVRTLERLLRGQGVLVLRDPPLDDRRLRAIRHYADHFPTSMAALRTYDYDEAHLGQGVASSLVAGTLDPFPVPQEHRALVAAGLSAAAHCFEQALILIDQHAPMEIVTFNGRFASAVGIAEAARIRNVPIRFHERGASVDRYEVYDALPHGVQFIQDEIRRYWHAGGPDRESIGATFYERRRKGEGINWMSYTHAQRPGALPPLPSGKRHVVYFSSSDHELEFIGRPTRRGAFEGQRDAVAHLMRWVARQADVALTIRVHPGQASSHANDRLWWERLAGPNVSVVPSAAAVDSYALLDAADLVVTGGSTMGAEATYWGKPSISVDASVYGGFDCVYEPASLEEFDALLAAPALAPKPREHCLPYGFYSVTFGFPFTHFAPTGLFSGAFLGVTLAWEREWLRRSRLLDAGRALRARFR